MSIQTELETDSIGIAERAPPYPRANEDELQEQLIEINEELGSEDLEVLKFLCYDILPASKLENADSALSIFENLKKGNRLTYTNLDILLECLWWMHRKDLIRKLGYDPKEVEPFILGLNQVLPFRKLLLELREDITDKEFDTLRFYLDGKVKKKMLQDKKNMLELFIFLEQEGLISHDKPEPLISLLNTIKRKDLVDLVKEHFGKPVKQSPSNVPPPTRPIQGQVQAGPGQTFPSVTADRNRQAVAPPPADPVLERIAPVGGGVVNNEDPGLNVGDVRPPRPVDRSASAGTMSVPSSLENEPGAIGEVQGVIPDLLLRRISQEVQKVADDFGMELGFSNVDIAAYHQQFPGPAERCYQMIKFWQARRLDQGQVGPGLKYALDKMGYKQVGKIVGDWLSSYSADPQPLPLGPGNQPLAPLAGGHMNIDVIREEPVFRPAGPPEPTNNYSSLSEARLLGREQMQINEETPQQMGTILDPVANLLPGNLNIEEVQRQLQNLSMAGVNPNAGSQIPPIDQHPMFNHAIGEPVVGGQGQGQVQTLPVAGNQPAMDQNEQDLISMELPTYPMNASPKGICVIINNRNFIVAPSDPGSREMPERRGTDVDAANLQEVFTKLDFLVELRENLTDTDMMQLLVNIAHNVDHSNYECFICCILTHGVLSHLYGTNGRLVAIKDLTAVFQANRCPSLAGKPKLFFLQACQGRDKMGGGAIERDAAPDVEIDNDKEMIPNESDFLVGYATVPGYVSFRSRNHGSWYIRKLCELLEKYSERHDLLSILVKVNEEVARANAHIDGGVFKQTPAPIVTLRKKLYFFNQNRRTN